LQPERDTKAELNRRSQVCDALAGTGIRVAEMAEHRGIAPRNPAWKAGVYLSTPMLEEMESRTGVAPVSAVLQTAA
jgi:hypothetical protein